MDHAPIVVVLHSLTSPSYRRNLAIMFSLACTPEKGGRYSMLLRLCHSMATPLSTYPRRSPSPWLCRCPILLSPSYRFLFSFSVHRPAAISALYFSTCNQQMSSPSDLEDDFPSKQGPLKPGLYLVGTPIGNLEDITMRSLRVLKSADVILSEDTRHSGKLLQYYNIRTPLLSYHKFNESQREQVVLRRLLSGEIVALISDAGMPGISDPGMDLAKLCVDKNIPIIPIPGPSAVVTALSASGLPTNEFTFVGFLPKHASTRRERLLISANSAMTQVFFVPPHKLSRFLEEASSIFGNSRRCVIAREMTKLHEEFWRGTLEEAREAFSTHQPKGEITLMIEGMIRKDDQLSESELENKLGELISKGHSLSLAVKVVASTTSMKRKAIYLLALEKFGNQVSKEKD